MSRSPIEIAIASETKAFKQGIETGVVKPLEDAIKSLRELGDAEGADRLERSLRDAQKATEQLEDKTRDAAQAIEREYKNAYREARRAADDGTGRMKAGAEEVTQELGQNIGEAVSSVRGDLSDLGQVGQDTLGGLAATLAGAGPAGLVGAAALAAAAVGAGGLTAALEDAAAKQERLKEQAAEWAQAYMEAGSSILNTSQIIAKGEQIFGDPEKLAEAQENMHAWGVELDVAVAAMAGSQSAIDDVSASIDRQAAALEANARGADNYAQNIEQATTGQSSANDEFLKGKAAFDELTGAMDIGQQTAGYYSRMLRDLAANTDGAKSIVDEFGDSITSLPDGTTIYIDAETGRATTKVDDIKQKIYSIPDKTAVVRVEVDSSAWDRWKPSLKVGAVATARTGNQVWE
ncbi:hypothetical protein GCM10023065_03020 [Microbacterium laevaniformans]|uniref:Uncharacterized protein n=1 Tax=Microbacterium laevaniformans TaxID=36807 RepID=A0A150HHV0_9MICO|nr:hypothetical protein [Microbacterium laevaniformans]KXZ61641.1 hypothetical protein Mlaev_00337 [Microbacterium laevaniformans]MBM7754188.1 Sec-independent protein translocase protein TatA [Microbacterium laevaniformans]GLJ65244.1 hypothetical protein GCM10017578_21330 [Microbacterium laevaniformans]